MFARFRTIALAGTAAAALLAPLPAAAEGDEEPLARFEAPLCPGVFGLQREDAETLVGRIRYNAEAFGLRLADNGDCQANLIVAFIDDAPAFLSYMEGSAPYLFDGMNLDDRHALLEGPGPVHVVQQVVPRARDGSPIPRYLGMTDIPQTTMWMAHSKIYSATRNDIEYALVLIDRDEIGGIGVGQLADYATFRGLTRTLPETRGNSILALFDGATERPTRLTEVDRAFLTTLYDGIPNLPASTKLAEIARATGTNPVE